MGLFSDAAKKAAEQTDKQLAEDLKDLRSKDLSACFPNAADKALVNELIAKIEASTDKNETITACQVVAAKLSSEGLKALKDGFQIAKRLVL